MDTPNLVDSAIESVLAPARALIRLLGRAGYVALVVGRDGQTIFAMPGLAERLKGQGALELPVEGGGRLHSSVQAAISSGEGAAVTLVSSTPASRELCIVLPFRETGGAVAQVLLLFGRVEEIAAPDGDGAWPQLGEAPVRMIAEAIPALVWTASPDGAIDYTNARWQAYSGQSPSEALGWGWLAMLHPDDIGPTLARARTALAAEEPFELESRFRRGSDKSYRWHLSRCVPLRQGTRLAWFGAAVDIDDRKRDVDRLTVLGRASEVLAASLDVGQTLVSLAELLVPAVADICVIDLLERDGSMRRVAAAHVDPARRRLLHLLGDRHLKAYDWHPVGRALHAGPELIARVNASFLAQTAVDSEQLALWLELAPCSAVLVPLVAQGRSLGVLSLATSQSGRIYGERDLELARELGRRCALALESARLYREATESNRLKDEFLATVSHELRTPLNAILGWAQLLRSTQLAPSDVAKGLETIERNARLQTRLIEDLLDISRIVAGRLRLETRAVRLQDVVNAAVESLRLDAEAKSLTLAIHLDGSVGEVTGDPGRLQQVVWNLVSNALKFTPPGGRVEVEVVSDGSHAQVVVKDTGRGFEPTFMPYLWQRFRQADASVTRPQGGMGLGLAIVRHLVELHDGRVWARSAGPGRGATFTVSLPLRAVANGAVGDRVVESPSALAVDLRGVRVLVVDDEENARDVIAMLLRQAGADVRVASSADEALDEMNVAPPDVLLSDIGMPNEDGYALIQRVRSRGPAAGGTVPAAALTAYAREQDALRATQAGYQLHIAKPVERSALLAAVRQLCRPARRPPTEGN